MGTFDRMQAELHSRWFGRNCVVKEDGPDRVIWRVVNAYYAVDDESNSPVTIAVLEIVPWNDDGFSPFKRVVEVSEVERI